MGEALRRDERGRGRRKEGREKEEKGGRRRDGPKEREEKFEEGAG